MKSEPVKKDRQAVKMPVKKPGRVDQEKWERLFKDACDKERKK